MFLKQLKIGLREWLISLSYSLLRRCLLLEKTLREAESNDLTISILSVSHNAHAITAITTKYQYWVWEKRDAY